MPFERYLRDEDHPNTSYHYQDPRHVHDNADPHYTPAQHSNWPENIHPHHALHLQIPKFMLNGPPILAPGGGAEVLPAGLLDNSQTLFAPWFANNGFAPLHSAPILGHPAPGSTPDNAAPRDTFSPNESQQPGFSPSFTPNVNQRQQPLPDPPPSLNPASTYLPNLASSPSPPTSFNAASYSLSNTLAPNPTPPFSLTVPSTLGLPVYSASGFDVISILARVLHRPNPTIQLGPVDLSCSFVIVDVRRFDSPIVYASPTFCHLTGYSEQEVLGRNCRFLQSPTGNIAKGEPRRFTSPEAVSYMRKLLSSSKECQTTLVNYRKDGQAFINLITVIPLRGGVHNRPEESDEVAYHIGFQVDLTEQPNRILDKLRDGSYHDSSWGLTGVASNAGLPCANHGLAQLAQSQNVTNIGTKGGRHGQMMSIAVSKDLKKLLADTTFTDSVLISTGTHMPVLTTSSGAAEQASNARTSLTMLVSPPSGSTPVNRMSGSGNTVAGSNPISISPALSLLLLEFLPDFVLVLSLKGAFLYVAPSVRLVLGYEPEDLVGKSISDICHPADLVPLMRELKEGSVSGLGVAGTSDMGLSTAPGLVPKSVDLLFRALPKALASSPHLQTQEASAERGAFQHLQSSPATGSQSSFQSGSSCSDDLSGGTGVPYVWLECRGRLHVEPGKGRKAIILSGRTRWMPVVRWKSVDNADGLRGLRDGHVIYGISHTTTGSSSSETSLRDTASTEPIDPLEFWALLSNHGTFLVASATVRDVLGWGTSEVIGRSLWAMLRDSRCDTREHVEAELAKLEHEALQQQGSAIDPPPTVVTTSLVHKELHTVPIRLVFYRTPRSRKYAPPSTSSADAPLNPLIHPLNNPLCPVVCQAIALSKGKHQPKKVDSGFGLRSRHESNQVNDRTEIGDDGNQSSTLPSSMSLFEELETIRGSSWQYELQQLKFANQRMQEEVQAIEAKIRARGGSSSGTGALTNTTLKYPCSSSTITQPLMAQTPSHYASLMHSTLSTSLPSVRPPNSLHDQDPPSSVWSSLAGANGQGTNPRKRPWRSDASSTA